MASYEASIIPLNDPSPVAAQRLGISRSSIYREIAIGRLASIKAGKRRLIPRAAQAAWVEALTLATAA